MASGFRKSMNLNAKQQTLWRGAGGGSINIGRQDY